ncbi:myosin-9 [Stomoxys calcitrans]|uniref:myosin-9 n=1 Tax=Stomoxys calcitrans TaxID=35570 RepID=UPI0027E317D6|nr:myosin-9 [Stomoxys calcitrans]
MNLKIKSVLFLIITLTRLSSIWAQDTEGTIKRQQQLAIDILLLKNDINSLNENLNSLKQRHNQQTEHIKKVKTLYGQTENILDHCHVNKAFSDFATTTSEIKQKVGGIINDNYDKHTSKLNQTLQYLNKLSVGCGAGERQVLIDLQRQIEEKLLKLKGFEQRLKQLQENSSNIAIQEEMQPLAELLNEIISKLATQEDKLKNFESVQPAIQNSLENIEAIKKKEVAQCHQKKCIAEKISKLREK